MSTNNPPFSASITGVFPIWDPPTLANHRLSFSTGIGSETGNNLPSSASTFLSEDTNIDYGEDDVCFISGSVIISRDDDGDLLATIDASNVNPILRSSVAEHLQPTTESTATFELIGVVSHVAGRVFTIDTGAYSHQVCNVSHSHDFISLTP
jgi:hypothetical protein